VVNNAVGYNGSSYIAIQAGTNHEPDTSTSHWSLLSQVGTTGATGATGAQGATGSTGVAGTNGTNGANGANGAGYAATSATSVAIATGSATFTTQSGLAFSAGARARASYSSNTADYMEGLVTSYSGTTLVINVDTTGGSGTFTSWNINVAGNVGATGSTPVLHHSFQYLFFNSGSALVASATAIGAFTVPAACTITSWDIDVSPSDTATVKTYKVATGTTHPTSTNSISTSGVSISSGGHLHSTTLTDFTTTSAAAYDIFAFALTAVGGTATQLTFSLECN
jgi:hypothetical protein